MAGEVIEVNEFEVVCERRLGVEAADLGIVRNT